MQKYSGFGDLLWGWAMRLPALVVAGRALPGWFVVVGDTWRRALEFLSPIQPAEVSVESAQREMPCLPGEFKQQAI